MSNTLLWEQSPYLGFPQFWGGVSKLQWPFLHLPVVLILCQCAALSFSVSDFVTDHFLFFSYTSKQQEALDDSVRKVTRIRRSLWSLIAHSELKYLKSFRVFRGIGAKRPPVFTKRMNEREQGDNRTEGQNNLKQTAQGGKTNINQACLLSRKQSAS